MKKIACGVLFFIFFMSFPTSAQELAVARHEALRITRMRNGLILEDDYNTISNTINVKMTLNVNQAIIYHNDKVIANLESGSRVREASNDVKQMCIKKYGSDFCCTYVVDYSKNQRLYFIIRKQGKIWLTDVTYFPNIVNDRDFFTFYFMGKLVY